MTVLVAVTFSPVQSAGLQLCTGGLSCFIHQVVARLCLIKTYFSSLDYHICCNLHTSSDPAGGMKNTKGILTKCHEVCGYYFSSESNEGRKMAAGVVCVRCRKRIFTGWWLPGNHARRAVGKCSLNGNVIRKLRSTIEQLWQYWEEMFHNCGNNYEIRDCYRQKITRLFWKKVLHSHLRVLSKCLPFAWISRIPPKKWSW